MIVVKMGEVPAEPATSALFTGNPVTRQAVFGPDDSETFNFGVVSFSAGSRNKFHTHTSDQVLIVTEGSGTVATQEEQRTVTAGDVVLIPAGEEHWHGAPDETPMAHIAITAKGSQTTQTEP
jgi:quercetin dioxygenase-like cupin family protein